MSRNFHFAFPATSLYRQLSLLQSFSAFVPEPKNRTRPGEPLPEPKGHDLRHLEAISQAVQSLRNNISSSGPRCAGVDVQFVSNEVVVKRTLNREPAEPNHSHWAP
jgi:hypothetical protein